MYCKNTPYHPQINMSEIKDNQKCEQFKKWIPLHKAFIDLTKAFDSVNREGLYIVLGKLGCPQKLLNLIRSLYTGMIATVAYENEESKAFAINNGVKQGCVLAPVLFNIYFSHVIRHAFQGNDEGIISKLDIMVDCLTSPDLDQRPN